MTNKSLPYWLIAPSAIFTVALFLYPLSLVALDAFTSKSGGYSLENFQVMVSHWKFGTALINTLLLTAVVVPLQMVVALSLAQLLTRVKSGRDTLLYVWTIPLGISDLAAGIIWLGIFEQTGFLNSALISMGVVDTPVSILGFNDTFATLVAIVMAEIWRSTAIVLVILVSGIGLIPKEYSEAAEVFGAGAWAKFTRVTLPLLRPSLQTALILRSILALEVFAVVAALSGTKFPVLMGETYNWQFALQDGPVAAAFALVILALSIGVTLVYLRWLRVPKGAGL
jgi:multiple sugar transport system permease protein